MIKYLLIFCLLLANNVTFARELPNFEQFIKILGKLESGNKDMAIGDNGKAISRYQIWEACYIDAREYDKSIKFSYQSITNEVNARKVVKAYISRYSKTDNFEDWARLWNGGPGWKKATGKKKENLDKYVKKFRIIQHEIGLSKAE
jgi:hypothetical protein